MEKFAIGIDIGGTNTALGLVDGAGRVVARGAFATADYPRFGDYPAYAARLAGAVGELLRSMPEGAAIEGIGIGAPNADGRTGRIVQPVNMWRFAPDEADPDPQRRSFPLCAELARCFPGVPVRMTNDANAAAWGEMIYGAARGMSDFIAVTLGTGVGAGIVCDGRVLEGRGGMAGELGHVTVEPAGRECGCGRRGCLEAYASASGLCRTLAELRAREPPPGPLRGIACDRIEALTVARAAEAGDPLALEAFATTARTLGRALADAAALLSPEAIVLSGGVARSGDLLLEPLRRSFEEAFMPARRGTIRLLASALAADNAAVLGASALVRCDRSAGA
ncbi:MAG: ROK family protein [Alistipes sp.]|nr:ROK family protein [Alistipes sp.]